MASFEWRVALIVARLVHGSLRGATVTHVPIDKRRFRLLDLRSQWDAGMVMSSSPLKRINGRSVPPTHAKENMLIPQMARKGADEEKVNTARREIWAHVIGSDVFAIISRGSNSTRHYILVFVIVETRQVVI